MLFRLIAVARGLAMLAVVAYAEVSMAADLRLQIVPAEGAESCLADAMLVQQDLATAGMTRVPLQGRADVPIPLHDGSMATVRVESPGCWSESVDLSGSANATILRVYPSSRAATSLKVPRGVSFGAPEATLFLEDVEAGGLARALNEQGHPTSCDVDDSDVQCIVPADVPFTLRLGSKGFAPVYYWNVVARADQVLKLEPAVLRRGASIAGWVEGPDGKPVEKAEVMVTRNEAAGPEEQPNTMLNTGRSDRRGFFQLTGISAGEYRLISRADGLSPVLLPVVNLSEGEALVWPRSIVHLPFAALEVHLTPTTDDDGKPWIISLAETVPLPARSTVSSASPSPRALRRAAGADGVWKAEQLRADEYRVTVEDGTGAVLERLVVDLSKSGTTTLPVSVTRIAATGVLRVGDRPLQAEIRFGNQSGRTVRATTNVLGEFDASFPAFGVWTPTIYLGESNGPSVRAGSLTLADGIDAPRHFEITLPGGEIRGTVANRTGKAEKAAVHVSRRGKLVAQQITDEHGKFAFIGIDDANYEIDAEGESGIARRLPVTVADARATDVNLVLEQVAHVSAVVFTPGGAPASGALVRVSSDGGYSWSLLFTDVDGRIDYEALTDGPLIVSIVTHRYPALLAKLPVSGTESTLTLQPAGGLLRIRHGRYVGRDGALVPLNMLFTNESPLGMYQGAAHVEPGVYAVCDTNGAGRECREVTIEVGEELTVDLAETRKETP